MISSSVYHTYRLKQLNEISYEDYKQKVITFIPRQGITKGSKGVTNKWQGSNSD